jgi:hypothetical protein
LRLRIPAVTVLLWRAGVNVVAGRGAGRLPSIGLIQSRREGCALKDSVENIGQIAASYARYVYSVDATNFFDKHLVRGIAVKIPKARFVRNPYPLKAKNASRKVFRQFRVLAHTIGSSILQWNDGAGSRERLLRGYESLEFLANLIQCFLSGASVAGHRRPIHNISYPWNQLPARCILSFSRSLEPNANRIVVDRPFIFED